MCGQATGLITAFVIPVMYIASCLVLHDLNASYRRLPTRRASMCDMRRDHFGALFVNVTDPRWDVERLERRAEVLGDVQQGVLLVFGGPKADIIAEEFQAAVATLRANMKDVDP